MVVVVMVVVIVMERKVERRLKVTFLVVAVRMVMVLVMLANVVVVNVGKADRSSLQCFGDSATPINHQKHISIHHMSGTVPHHM